ncbi:MAG: 30S ribosomal protein S12 methylthiotransferase RimO [Nitrospinales bacterium]
MKKIGMVSLGCPKNSVDTELVLGDLAQSGYEITPVQEEADVIIVNTCGFIESAKRESIDAILEMARLKSEGRCQKLVVTGCLSERYSEELLKEIPEIDLMLGVNQYPRLKHLLATVGETRRDGANGVNHVNDAAEYYESFSRRALTTPFYSAYLKIAEGCSHQCAFCYIPQIRGAFRSRPMESIVEEARGLAQGGVKEFNLISQVTTLYGADLRMKDGLVQLLKALAAIEGVEWLRLLYCYPTFLGTGLIDYIGGEDKVCNYIDVPLQHIDDGMLRRMKRQESEKDVRALLAELRRKIPGVALRTTFITGFPGETDAQFRRLADFLAEIEFDHVGVFTYSDEEGTAAYDYPDRVPGKTARERKDELMHIQRAISRRKNARRVGQVYPVLVERLDDEFLLTGRFPFQAPEIDGQVILEKTHAEPGQILPARVTASLDYDLIACAEEAGKA